MFGQRATKSQIQKRELTEHELLAAAGMRARSVIAALNATWYRTLIGTSQPRGLRKTILDSQGSTVSSISTGLNHQKQCWSELTGPSN